MKEKAQTLLKSLPQKIRRHCVPIADFAGGFFTRTKEESRRRRASLKRLPTTCGPRLAFPYCRRPQARAAAAASHHELQGAGRAWSPDRHGAQSCTAARRVRRGGTGDFRHVAQEDAAVAKDLEDGITDCRTFGELPELMEISRRGQTLIGHPALTDRGTDCAIEVYDDPLEARREHRKGLLRLFRLALREQVKFVERTLRDLGRAQMQAQTVPGLSRLFESADTLSTSSSTARSRQRRLPNPGLTMRQASGSDARIEGAPHAGGR